MAKRIYKKVINKRRYKRSMRNVNYMKPMVDTQYTPIYAESMVHTQTNATTDLITFTSGFSYINLASILVSSNSYQQAKGQFSRVKVTAIEIFVTDGSSPANIESAFSPKTFPVCAFNFYPGKAGTSLGDGPLYSDDSLSYHSGVTTKAYKKYDFNKKRVDRSSLSPGEWLDPLLETNYYGQLSIAEYAMPLAIATVRVHNVRIRVTCVFSSRLI